MEGRWGRVGCGCSSAGGGGFEGRVRGRGRGRGVVGGRGGGGGGRHVGDGLVRGGEGVNVSVLLERRERWVGGCSMGGEYWDVGVVVGMTACGRDMGLTVVLRGGTKR